MVSSISFYAARVYLDKLTGASDTPELVKRRAADLRVLLTVLGPSFIKAGQVLANRPDIGASSLLLCTSTPPSPILSYISKTLIINRE